jgi:hypothetical protein
MSTMVAFRSYDFLFAACERINSDVLPGGRFWASLLLGAIFYPVMLHIAPNSLARTHFTLPLVAVLLGICYGILRAGAIGSARLLLPTKLPFVLRFRVFMFILSAAFGTLFVADVSIPAAICLLILAGLLPTGFWAGIPDAP